MFMRWIIFVLTCLMMNSAWAYCVIYPEKASPQTFNIPGDTFTIDVTAQADTSRPIATYLSPRQAGEVAYVGCVNGDRFGKSVINLTNQDLSTHIFPTNIPGIGIKVRWNNSVGIGDYPSVGTMDFGAVGTGSMTFASGSYFIVEFYKTKDTLSLSNPSGELIIAGKEIAYNWVNADSPANYGQRLVIGAFKLISTPSCTFNDNKTVDFNTVTSRLLAANIERDLKISMTCNTDYGSWTAAASILTDTPSEDGNYIKVKDAAGNQDVMGIKIVNGLGRTIKIDGSETQELSGLLSASAAEFNWKAVLFPLSTTRPTNGVFSARAEVLLQLR